MDSLPAYHLDQGKNSKELCNTCYVDIAQYIASFKTFIKHLLCPKVCTEITQEAETQNFSKTHLLTLIDCFLPTPVSLLSSRQINFSAAFL